MNNLENKELEIKVKKIILHNKIHELLRDIKADYRKSIGAEPGEIDEDDLLPPRKDKSKPVNYE